MQALVLASRHFLGVSIERRPAADCMTIAATLRQMAAAVAKVKSEIHMTWFSFLTAQPCECSLVGSCAGFGNPSIPGKPFVINLTDWAPRICKKHRGTFELYGIQFNTCRDFASRSRTLDHDNTHVDLPGKNANQKISTLIQGNLI
jgi:hypothetical protein